jgi:hypothetical protein
MLLDKGADVNIRDGPYLSQLTMRMASTTIQARMAIGPVLWHSHQMARSLHQLHMIPQCDSGMPLPGLGNRHSRAITVRSML